jgi:hypothetical protein
MDLEQPHLWYVKEETKNIRFFYYSVIIMSTFPAATWLLVATGYYGNYMIYIAQHDQMGIVLTSCQY